MLAGATLYNVRPTHIDDAGTGKCSRAKTPYREAGARRRAARLKPRGAEPTTAPPISNAANRKNMVLLIQFRWIAVIGQLVTIVMVQYGLGIPLPLPAMLAVLGALILVNVASFIWLRLHEDISSAALLLVSMLDVFALTAQLWLSGGATNPFVSLYLLQITMAAILLDAQSTWLIVALAFTGFVVLVSFHQPLRCRAAGPATCSRCTFSECSSASFSMRRCLSSS